MSLVIEMIGVTCGPTIKGGRRHGADFVARAFQIVGGWLSPGAITAAASG
jgi:hypothetical protein